ncbi:hypothetical protein MMAG44476_15430 [Mycolicibacterium mageritense DSM 44476 = CIP 104973]|uniref:Uncharacterized protein n=1 Tax=Mycolicibacterium mageritense TaxID=53462 RepID=A0ABN5Y6V4_MYCME|nr:hypothetical protein [Mycolicibacterium mageritense]MCC9186275.1 hypothetical protein [Mycolicibacterium mageritense]BBX33862.1 hypothetical protein MMAGJ_31440 [Mycolicibacterium mageritense]CDO22284.1 hypothetical protein BN978_02755 [Mycolicibacterium mageritense DSM 44476 = CIP 104973]
MDSLVTVAVPALVAVLTAAGAIIGVQFRDVDAYERRRGFWQLLLVLVAALSTWFATQTASSGGQLYEVLIIGAFGFAAVTVAHVLWRRLVLDADHSTRWRATTAAVAAVVVLIGSITWAYYNGAGCRQVKSLMQVSTATAGALVPSMAPAGQGPTSGDYDEWAKVIGEQAQQVTSGSVAESARTIADLARQIADAERSGDKARHAILGTKIQDQLVAIRTECPSQR